MSVSASDPRPTDMAELAKLVAKELRKPTYGKLAAVFDNGAPNSHITVWVLSVREPRAKLSSHPTWRAYIMFDSRFDNLTPSECANLIQAEEAKRAAEWAGDK